MTVGRKAPLPLALTLGEPAGIGPELTARIWHGRRKHAVPSFFLVGPRETFSGLSEPPPLMEIGAPGEAIEVFEEALPLLVRGNLSNLRPGQPDPANAAAVIASIETAVELAVAGEAGGIVTNPIQKSSLKAAGFRYAGHTDFLAALCAIPPERAIMMLAAGDFRVVPITHHLPLKEAIGRVSASLIVDYGRRLAAVLQEDFAIGAPRLAVAGLNPHAGEEGAFGSEEIEEIAPAVKRLRKEGIQAAGPFPPDTLFTPALRASYDAALCMYHDQALIPVKTLGIEGAVNITLGLPVIRTSPAHGTALGLVGKGTASPDSLRAALRTAAAIADARR